MLQKQNILIAGATGLIGTALVNHFLQKEYGIIVLSQNKVKAKQLFGNTINYLTWQEIEETERIFPKVDIVINLAGANIGAKPWTKKYKKKILDSRVKSIRKLNQFINKLKAPPKQWIQASAIGIYGSALFKANNEQEKPGLGFLADVVKQWENTFNKMQLPYTTKTIVRFGIVISSKGGLLPQLTQSATFKFIACPGNGKNILSWIHINDLTRIIDFVLSNKHLGIFNVSAPFPIPMYKAMAHIKHNKKSWAIIKIPKQILYLVLGKEKANELALASQIALPNHLLKLGFEFNYPRFQDCLT